ncbi:MAG: TrkH family potassium uptake protein [bacterium]
MVRKQGDIFIEFLAILALLLMILGNSHHFTSYAPLIATMNLIIFSVFTVDILIRLFSDRNKNKYLLPDWFDIVVIFSLFQFIFGIRDTAFWIMLRGLGLVIILITRRKGSKRLITIFNLEPAQLMVTSFALAIFLGTTLLMLPEATRAEAGLSFIDALFTATSATCVTGLIVKDTGSYFSFFGQMIILLLIQMGGIGIMTFSISLAFMLHRHMGLRQQAAMQDILDQDTLTGMRRLIIFILKMTVLFEAIGTLLLFLIWRSRFRNIPLRLYHSTFHAVSAFCNAGFSTFSNSLMGFSNDVWTQAVMGALIVAGGFGFPVVKDLYDTMRNKFFYKGKSPFTLKVQTKMVLKTSLLLIGGGAFIMFASERNQAFNTLAMKEKVLAALFQSITCRTAGFHTFQMARLSSATILLFIVLMIIGASPGSTGGGIKTTTISVLWAAIAGGFRQKAHVEIHKRTIPDEVIHKAIAVYILSLAIITVFTFLLLSLHGERFLNTLFEAVSAFGTVGLSMGITPGLSLEGKIIVSLLMFIGRLGPLTMGYAFIRYKRPTRYVYAQERIMIG